MNVMTEIEVDPGHGGMVEVPAGHTVTVTDGHRSCAANLAEAYPASHAVPTPQPVNIFMKVDEGVDGSLALGESPSAPGDAITVRAVRDCVVVVSVCPQDLIPISRGGLTPLRLTVRP